MTCSAVGGTRWRRRTGSARATCSSGRQARRAAEVLDSLSQAAPFWGQYARAIELKTRAFAAYRRRGKRAEAAELARWLAFLHRMVQATWPPPAGGWRAAERLLQPVDECAAHGWLTLDRAPFTRDASERERLATAALAIGRRFGDADLEFDALALVGRVLRMSPSAGCSR
jgi:hypothetical protein